MEYMYVVGIKNKNGSVTTYHYREFNDMLEKVKALHRQCKEANILKNGKIIGRIWKDDTWNYYVSKC